MNAELTCDEADVLVDFYRQHGAAFEAHVLPARAQLLLRAIRKLEEIAYDSP